IVLARRQKSEPDWHCTRDARATPCLNHSTSANLLTNRLLRAILFETRLKLRAQCLISGEEGHGLQLVASGFSKVAGLGVRRRQGIDCIGILPFLQSTCPRR